MRSIELKQHGHNSTPKKLNILDMIVKVEGDTEYCIEGKVANSSIMALPQIREVRAPVVDCAAKAKSHVFLGFHGGLC